MKTRLYTFVIIVIVLSQHSFGQASYQIPISVTNGANETDVLQLGVNPGNTIGIDTSVAFGRFRELLRPPGPPCSGCWDVAFMTIPGRITTFPKGLAGGVHGDFRGYVSATQIDSFKIVIAGDVTDTAATTISWQSDLANYGISWTIKPQVGLDWPTTNMLNSSTVVIGPRKHKNNIINKVGALGTYEVEFRGSSLPSMLTLEQNYPNPFNPATTITFALPKSGYTTLKVFDILGREIATLVDGVVEGGVHQRVFDAANLSSGTFFYRLDSAGFVAVKKLLVLK